MTIPRRLIDTHPFLAAIVVNAFILILIGVLRGFVFETVDDYNVMMTLSGEKTGYPFWQTTFFNSIFAFLQTRLYKLYGGVQWYSLIQFVMMYISLNVILGVLLAKTSEYRLSPLIAFICYVMMFLSFLYYAVQRMQFTSTAALQGAAACILLFSIDGRSHNIRTIAVLIICSLSFLMLCFIERRSAGLAALIFFAIGVARLIIYMRCDLIHIDSLNRFIRRLVIPCSIVLAVGAVFVGGHLAVLHYGDNASYAEYDKWRAAYQDYPHVTYKDHPEVFEPIGWDQHVYTLVQSLIFIDENIDGEHFRALVESPENIEARYDLGQAVILVRGIAWGNAAGKGITLGLIGVLCFSVVFFATGLKKGLSKQSKLSLLCIADILLCAVVLVLYQGFGGRFSMRVYQSIAFPVMACCVMLCFEIISSYIFGCSNSNLRVSSMMPRGKHVATSTVPIVGFLGSEFLSMRSGQGVVAFAITLLVWFMGWGGGSAQQYIDTTLRDRDESTIAQMASVEEYAVAHPEQVFLHDYSISNVYDSYNPFRVYQMKPTNLIISGGSYTYTSCYYRQLAKNGLSDLNGATLLKDNVYYICDPTRGSGYQNIVLAYLQSRYEGVEIKEVKKLVNNATVYKFTQEIE